MIFKLKYHCHHFELEKLKSQQIKKNHKMKMIITTTINNNLSRLSVYVSLLNSICTKISEFEFETPAVQKPPPLSVI
ncbi:hypothetical protein DERF_005904 [Dermatophagoides farinae]|uniref:Uncharacterized protein n=1 Tax=Dermatophagoides farinae TaxID=6954 RepID=A0A922I6J0_DERFA|nr:hypothetical protein DERF_005904 [Dermatophagoides farinae]